MEIAIAVASTIVVVAPLAMGAGAYLHYRFGKMLHSIAEQLKNVHVS